MRSRLEGDRTGSVRCPLVLGGVGGIGKTQPAIAYAQQYLEMHDSIFWLNASDASAVKLSFRSMAKVIYDNQDLNTFDDEHILTAIRQWLFDPHNTQWRSTLYCASCFEWRSRVLK